METPKLLPSSILGIIKEIHILSRLAAKEINSEITRYSLKSLMSGKTLATGICTVRMLKILGIHCFRKIEGALE